VRWTNSQGRVFTDVAGNPVRMVGTGRDITDRKETERERDELLEQERTARLLRETFIGVLSHELRTPITTILGGAQILVGRIDRMTADDAKGLLEDIEQEAERLARLIEDLLILTRSERGNVESRDDPVLPSAVVDTVIHSSAAVAQRVKLDVQVPRNLPIVIGDETYLEQILRNLVGNAAKFSPVGSTVSIHSEVTADEVLLRVLDEGPGIEPDETDRLFEVFYRSPRTRAKAAGSGIGLFVAKQLVGAMGGRIWAVPRPTGGAEFGIALRRHELPAEDPGQASDVQ
jgi:two-component system sensor histidine kinase KdpD